MGMLQRTLIDMQQVPISGTVQHVSGNHYATQYMGVMPALTGLGDQLQLCSQRFQPTANINCPGCL